ncbi:metal-dependent hydrolase [bacterium]|nr:metal-dependent hydrolase [bacterium]
MHIQTHFLLSWLIADSKNNRTNQELFCITFCGVAPDLDGLGILQSVEAYHHWHHTFGHSFLTAFFVFMLSYFLFRKVELAALCTISFVGHLICDYLGSAGSDGYIWPIYFLWPFSKEAFINPYQWPLMSSTNLLVTVISLFIVIKRASKKNYSPIRMFSRKIDVQVVAVFKRWFFEKSENQ